MPTVPIPATGERDQPGHSRHDDLPGGQRITIRDCLRGVPAGSLKEPLVTDWTSVRGRFLVRECSCRMGVPGYPPGRAPRRGQRTAYRRPASATGGSLLTRHRDAGQPVRRPGTPQTRRHRDPVGRHRSLDHRRSRGRTPRLHVLRPGPRRRASTPQPRHGQRRRRARVTGPIPQQWTGGDRQEAAVASGHRLLPMTSADRDGVCVSYAAGRVRNRQAGQRHFPRTRFIQ
ncbi:MAG: hypothetical protein AVDCRST_MAG33-22 [uncultured Thermomicrobiales bacterium]|uniref:Uncharacterized protein n=1 Tax=uncultured Thermomicrobiales bacterium TaxID=1645740 RepID=A0A6J4U802_9BACT|nr:MAG: hypothetical protein AVDCRST_MAG33-22 [uncultured Thermomicrobiales bacterium]